MAKHRRRLSPDTENPAREKLDRATLLALLISAIGPIAKLVDAISRIR